MNTDISHVRSLLLLKIAVALMFVSLVVHPIREFNPENYVKEWMDRNHSHADYTFYCQSPTGRSHKMAKTENIWKCFLKECKARYMLSKSICLHILEKVQEYDKKDI